MAIPASFSASPPTHPSVTIEFDGQNVEYTKSELSEVQHAYAISIHKSQGSEYPVVLIPLLKQHFMMLQRNLVYTGITRARQKVFLVGSPEAYAMAVRNNKTEIGAPTSRHVCTNQKKLRQLPPRKSNPEIHYIPGKRPLP